MYQKHIFKSLFTLRTEKGVPVPDREAIWLLESNPHVRAMHLTVDLLSAANWECRSLRMERIFDEETLASLVNGEGPEPQWVLTASVTEEAGC